MALATLMIARGDTDDAMALLGRIPETPETRLLSAEARLVSQHVDVDGADVGDLLDGLLERVARMPPPVRSSSTCSRPWDPTIPGPPTTARRWRPGSSE